MNMKRNYQNIRRIVLLLCVVLGSYVQTMAQPDPVITARAFYENGDYNYALNLYLQTNESRFTGDDFVFIGNMYYNGWGTTRNYKKAAEYYEKGDWKFHNKHALYYLGMMYIEGKGVDANYRVADSKLYEAAYKGITDAFYQLGMIYLEGKAEAKVFKEKAGMYFTEGARKGNFKCMNILDDYPDLDLRRKEVEITVYDYDGSKCIGATVKFEKSKNNYAAATDHYGKAKIKAKYGDQLKVMYIGCKTQYLNIGDSKSYVVRLKKN